MTLKSRISTCKEVKWDRRSMTGDEFGEVGHDNRTQNVRP